MTDVELAIRESFERVFPTPAAPVDWGDVLDRAGEAREGPGRERARTPGGGRRLAVAFAVAALVVAVGAATALGVRMFILDKGFVGLPTEGATPSAPESGRLVLSLAGRSTTDGRLIQVWVYEDGRVIWTRHGSLPEGANELTTGLLEQHLTPAGVERLRSEVVSTGLFDHDLELKSGRFVWGEVTARVGDRLVHVGWWNPDPYDIDPDSASRIPATTEQDRALKRLDALLWYPSWRLPESAWEDITIRAYVPSAFAVCYAGFPVDASQPQSDPGRVLSLLPQAARDLLGGKDRTRRTGQRGLAGGPWYPSVSECSNVTTEEARALVRALDGAGLEREGPAAGIAYTFGVPGPIEESAMVTLEPLLPDGQWTSFRTG
jgi:hypothetical protein